MNGPDDRLADSRTPGLSTLWIVLVALVADQISKYIVTITMTEYGPPIEVLGTFFRLTYIHNRGAAFGLNLGSPLIHTVVSIAALALLVAGGLIVYGLAALLTGATSIEDLNRIFRRRTA